MLGVWNLPSRAGMEQMTALALISLLLLPCVGGELGSHGALLAAGCAQASPVYSVCTKRLSLITLLH